MWLVLHFNYSVDNNINNNDISSSSWRLALAKCGKICTKFGWKIDFICLFLQNPFIIQRKRVEVFKHFRTFAHEFWLRSVKQFENKIIGMEIWPDESLLSLSATRKHFILATKTQTVSELDFCVGSTRSLSHVVSGTDVGGRGARLEPSRHDCGGHIMNNSLRQTQLKITVWNTQPCNSISLFTSTGL